MKLHSDQYTKYYFEKSYKHRFQSKGGKNALHHAFRACQKFHMKNTFYLFARQELQLISAVILCIQTKQNQKRRGQGWEKEKKNIFPKNFVISNAMQPGITHSTISKEMIYKCNREQCNSVS